MVSSDQQGIAKRLWASSVGGGNMVMLLIAPSIAVSYGWYLYGGQPQDFPFSLLLFLHSVPHAETDRDGCRSSPCCTGDVPSLMDDIKDVGKGMANNGFWMIGIGFGCYNLVAMALVTFYPQFLEVVRGYSLTYDNGVLMHASFVTALILGIPIFTGPIGGYISDRLGKRKIMILIPIPHGIDIPFPVQGNRIIN
jgi:hypothetical protein